MDELVHECVVFMSSHLLEVCRLPHDLSSLPSHVFTLLANVMIELN